MSGPKGKSSPANDAPPGSLNRGAVILTAIARGSSKGSLLTELVARTKLPRTTIVRTLSTLLDLEWIVRDAATSRYNLGIHLAGLGYSAISRNPLERLAENELYALASKLNQTVYLIIRSGFDMICIGRYESQSEIQIGKGGVGLRGPFGMTQSCMGMMAKMPEHEVLEIIEVNMHRYHRIEGFDESGFRKTVQQAMQNDYGTYDNIILDRTTSGLGVAICDSVGYPLAGIGTTYLSNWLTEDQKNECLFELKQTASRIEQRLL